MTESATALQQTRQWISDFIIKLNICPFAAKPFNDGLIDFQTLDDVDFETLYKKLLTAIDAFHQLDPDKAEAGFLIVTAGLTDFDEYLEMLELLDEAIDESGLRGTFQLASFHPDYCFDGVPEDDPANATNRSPYPMFHIIREESLAEALKSYPEPEKIPERNIELLISLADKTNGGKEGE